MRHRKAGIKLNRTTSHRNAMFRNMVTSLFKYERIRTTGAKAKELRRWADHIITLAKRGDLHARRQALSIVRERDVVHKLFEEAAERFGGSAGGYTRIVKLGRRPGDAAPISLIELIVTEEKRKKTKKKADKAKVEKKKTAAPQAAEKAEEPQKEDKKQAKTEAKAPQKESVKAEPEKKAAVTAKKASQKKAAAEKEEAKPEAKAKPAAKAEKVEDKKEAKPDAKAKKAPKKQAAAEKAEAQSKSASKKKASTDKE